MLPRARRRWTPRRLPGLKAWFEARRLSGLADSAAVSTWPDLSGNGVNVTQATESAQPAYRTDLTFPVVRFDGGDSLNNATLVIAQPCTVLVAGKVTDKTANTAAVGPATNITAPYVGAVATSGVARGAAGLNVDALSTDWSAAFAVVTVIFNTTASTIWFNNTATTGSISTGTFVNLRIGNNFTVAPWIGDLTGIIICAGAMSTADRLRAQTYLGATCGVVV